MGCGLTAAKRTGQHAFGGTVSRVWKQRAPVQVGGFCCEEERERGGGGGGGGSTWLTQQALCLLQ